MKTLLLSILLSILPLGFVKAEVEPVNIFLHDGKTRYDVPAKKVLIIEHFMWALESNFTLQRVAISPPDRPSGVGEIQLKFPEEPDMHTPTRPIRLLGGGRVSISFNSAGSDWRDVMVVGLLVDFEDLYAANINTELDNTRVVGGKLFADVKIDSPRPRILKVQSAQSIGSFNADASSRVQETTSPSAAVASVPVTVDRKFMRVLATTRGFE